MVSMSLDSPLLKASLLCTNKRSALRSVQVSGKIYGNLQELNLNVNQIN